MKHLGIEFKSVPSLDELERCDFCGEEITRHIKWTCFDITTCTANCMRLHIAADLMEMQDELKENNDSASAEGKTK